MQTKREEQLNALTHGFGIFLSCIGFVVLWWVYDPKKIDFLYLAIYAISLIVLYTASTWYHSVEKVSHKKFLRKIDHISIYLLIAGTYTPVCVTVLKHSKGSILLALVWGIAVFGFILKLFFTGRFEKISLFLYLLMGWLLLLDLQAFVVSVDHIVLIFLGAGGFFYTFGIIFYVLHRLPYHHVYWHIFVLLGSSSHFMVIYYLIT